MAWPAKGGKPSPAPAAFGGKKGPSPFKGGAAMNGKGPATFRATDGRDGGMLRSSFKGPPQDAKGGFRGAPLQMAPPASGKGFLGSKGSVFTRADAIGGGGKKGGDFGAAKGFQREPAAREGYGAAFNASPRPFMGAKGPVAAATDRFDPKGGKKGPLTFSFKGAPPGIQQPPPPMGKGGEKGKRPRVSPAERIQSGEPVQAGVVRSFNPDKKNGFIDVGTMISPQHSSVYVFQDVLERALPARAGPGDRVAFFVHWSPKGQPQASSPLIKLKAGLEDGTYAQKGTFKSGKDGGFGFIECGPTREFFGRDVYVNKDLAAGLETGQLVCFNVYLNRDGMPNAEGLEICDEFWQPPEADLSMQVEVDTGKGKGKSKGPGAPDATGQISSGVIKNFNQVSNYGFIESEELKSQYGGDVFMHRKEFEQSGAKVGDRVVFEVATNSRGQPQAINIFPDGAGEPPAKRQRLEEPVEEELAEVPLDAGAEGYDGDYYDQPAEDPLQAEGLDNFSFSDMLNANDGSYE